MLVSKWKNLIPERRTAYGWGLIVAVLGAAMLLLPGRESWHAAGPVNVGHAKIDCGECHIRAPGNFAGQAFENLMYATGLADSATHFIFKPVGNDQCLACHDNPDDRHPVAEFMKSEFVEARRAMGVQSCVSCHQQHLGVRVSVMPQFCQYCHEDTEMENDPLDVPHTVLISEQRWETCLGCHDFHGNHQREAPTMMSQALTEEQIQRYLGGGVSPYGRRRLTAIQTMRGRDD